MTTKQKFSPILFSTEMVQAILAGRKTQTRRIIEIKTTPFIENLSEESMKKHLESTGAREIYGGYNAGDILWVRESATVCKIEAMTIFHFSGEKPVGYKSIQKIGIKYCDGERVIFDYPERLSLNIKCEKKLAYGIFKEAARIFLKVTNVRVERLQDISEEDAIAEGIEPGEIGFKSYNPKNIFEVDALWSFRNLWDSINGKKHPWDSNPWVWVYEFERIEKPTNWPL